MIKKDEDKIISILNDKVDVDIDLKSNFNNIRIIARDSILYSGDNVKKAFKPKFALVFTSVILVLALVIVGIPLVVTSFGGMRKSDAAPEKDYNYSENPGGWDNKTHEIEQGQSGSDVMDFRYLNVDEMSASDLKILLNKLMINADVEDDKTYNVYSTKGISSEFLTISTDSKEETYQINADYKIEDIYNQITGGNTSISISVYVDGDNIVFYANGDKENNIVVK